MSPEHPTPAYITVNSWAGRESYLVQVVGSTATKYRIRALVRTALAGRGRWLDPGDETLVPKDVVTFPPAVHA